MSDKEQAKDGKLETDAYLLEQETIKTENGNMQVFKHREEIQAVSTEFMKKDKYTQEELDAYLKEHNYPQCTVQDLEDLIAERRSYEKLNASTRYTIKQLAKIQPVNPFVHSKEQIENLYRENDKLQSNILDHLSDQGIEFSKIADVVYGVQTTVNGVVQEMLNRLTNRKSEIERVALYEVMGGDVKVTFKQADQWLEDTFKARGLKENPSRYGYEKLAKETDNFTKEVKKEGVDNSQS